MTSNWASVIIVGCLCATLVTCSVSSDRRVEEMQRINSDGMRAMIRMSLKHCEDEYPDDCFMAFHLDGSRLNWRLIVEGDKDFVTIGGGSTGPIN